MTPRFKATVMTLLLSTASVTFAATTTAHLKDAINVVIPYKQININQDYIGQGITEIADMGAYVGGGADALTLLVTNNTPVTLWLRQTSYSNQSQNAIVALPAGKSINVPGAQWTTTAIKNIWMKVLNCGTKVPTTATEADKECTQICNSATTAPDTWKNNDGVNKVPFGGTINTFSFNGDGSDTTLCPWTHNGIPVIPTPTLVLPGTTIAASDLLAQDIKLDTKYMLVDLEKNVSQQDYDTIESKLGAQNYPCKQYATNQILCTYQIHLPAGKYNKEHNATLQMLLNDGVRAVTPVEEANLHLQSQPDLNEVQIDSAATNYSANPIKLSDYFADPSQTDKAKSVAKKP